MPDTPQLLMFIVAGWLLNLTPGPDVLVIVTQALRHGVRAGLATALGVVSGCFVHVLLAALGVGALLAASHTAFTVLKWAGALYLLWAGWRLLRSGPADAIELKAASAGDTGASGQKSLQKSYAFGFWTNVLNPKVALFFLAFVPQFIAADAPHRTLSFLLLGLLFNVNSLPINFGYALLAGWAAQRRVLVQSMLPRLERVAGLMLVGFGVRLALTDNPAP
ncbi:MAG: LysE family translocator [Rhodoferax sp.]|nr:LysE family translocator [Rhodoferax sp.]